VPNTLTLSLYVLMAAWFALNGVRRWGTVERGLRELAARRWVVIVSRLVRVAAVPASIGLWWLHGLVLIPAIVLLMAAHSVASAPASLVRLTGGSDPDLARATTEEAARRARLRTLWDEFSALAFRRAGKAMSRAARRRTFDALQAELEPLKSGTTAEVAELLAVQAEAWVFPTERWCLDEVRREITLFEAASRLWSSGRKPEVDPEAQLLWELFQAWHSLVRQIRTHEEPDPAAERAGLARIVTLTNPRTKAFVDLATELVEGRLQEPPEDAPELPDRLDDAASGLWPGVWVFRGARLD